MIRAGDIGFCHERKSWIGRAIAWFMRSRWSHSFLILGELESDWVILETSSFEVTIGLLSRYTDSQDFDVEVWRLNGEDAAEAKECAEKAAKEIYGTTYGYLQLLSFAVVTLLERFRIPCPNFIRQGIVCTGVVLTAKSNGTVPGFAGIDPESIHTQRLWEMVKLASQRIIRG